MEQRNNKRTQQVWPVRERMIASVHWERNPHHDIWWAKTINKRNERATSRMKMLATTKRVPSEVALWSCCKPSQSQKSLWHFFSIPICLLENSHFGSSKSSLYWTAESGLYNKSALLYHSAKWRTHTYTSVGRTPKSCINQRRHNRCHRHIKIVGHPRWKQNRRSKRSMATIRRTVLLLLVEYSTRLIGACVWVGRTVTLAWTSVNVARGRYCIVASVFTPLSVIAGVTA